MNKKRVDNWILKAKEAIEVLGISNEGKVDKAYRGQISSFGAAIVMGSFKSAIAFFSTKGECKVDRPKLIQAAYYVLSDRKIKDPKIILEDVCKLNATELMNIKNDFIDASVAVKLALNFFELV